MADPDILPDWTVPSVSASGEDQDPVPSVSASGEDQDPVPSFSETYTTPEDPETSGYPSSFSSLYMPNLYAGLIDALTFLIDIPTMVAGYALGEGAEALGFEESAKRFKNPLLLSDIGKAAFEAPRVVEEAITGEPAGSFTSAFDATPRAPRSSAERFWKDFFYIGGGGLSFPTALAGAFGAFRGPVTRLLANASGRGTNSAAAQAMLEKAYTAKGPNAVQALIETARQYAAKFTLGLGDKPVRTLSAEQLLATAAATGYALPERWADKDGRIMVDLGDDAGEVDIAPSVKILSSMGLPIALAHTPTGIMLTADKTKLTPLIKWVRNKGKVFGKSLIGGFTDKGRFDLASRIFNAMEAEPGVLENILLPAIESGHFRSPGTPPALRVLEDGTVVPEAGGLRPDTLQALKQLGYDETRLAKLDASLAGREGGRNLNARIGAETRRARVLDKTFDLLKSHVGLRGEPGDEAVTYRAIEQARNQLDKEALDSLEKALQKARTVFQELEPSIGRAEASRLAVEMLDGARLASRDVRTRLWDKDLVGTEYVDTSKFGDWALDVIKDMGIRNARVTPGIGIFYKLAGQERLASIGVGESGKPLTLDDLAGAKGDAGVPMIPEEVPLRGLYDVFGEPGTLYAEVPKISMVDKLRSEISDLSHAAYRRGDAKLGGRYRTIVNYIDDELLAPKNFADSDLPLFAKLKPANLENIELNRLYTIDAKERFGPNSEIGRILYRGAEPVPEEFLQRLLRTGPGSGARVDLFRHALNEPQQVVQNGKATWQRDPEAGLALGDSPNVIEADLLRRFTESVPPNQPVSQKQVDRFLTQYKDAVDEVPGLRDKFNNLTEVQKAVDEMAAKLTVPDREKVFAALSRGATVEDVQNAKLINTENLVDRQLANAASHYLNADPDQAARTFIESSPQLAATRADEIAALLAKDESGAAAAGFRAALWRALRESSRRFSNDGSPMPGIETKKLVDTIESHRPYLEKFYDKSSMEFLDELVKGGSLQRTGTGSPHAGTVQDVMAANFATTETIGAAGRTAGQRAFGVLGINPLVATGMGRRIAAYTFNKVGEEKIMKLVEDALRDPEKAAALIRRFRELPDWTPPPKTLQTLRGIGDDPEAALRAGAGEAKDRLARIADFGKKVLKGHSLEAVQRAVRYGLVPAQAEARRMTLEEDYSAGRPFVFEDNRIRYEIENAPDDEPRGPLEVDIRPLQVDTTRDPDNDGRVSAEEAAYFTYRGQPWGIAAPMPERPAPVRRTSNIPAPRPVNPASGMSNVSPVGPADTGARGRQVFPYDPIFSEGFGYRHGGLITGGAGSGMGRKEQSEGIMSIRCKPRQLVG